MEKLTMEKIVNLSKQYGFVFQGSEIYGGLSNTFDYGPLGTLLKDNIRNAWLKKFVQESPYNVGLDAAIFMNPKVWIASGHVGSFSDPLVDCKECKSRHRADKLIEDWSNGETVADGWSNEKMLEFMNNEKINCPKCGKLNYTDIRQFNMMFKTHQGVLEDASSIVYLRPETAQGIFVNFTNVQRSMRLKVPFGIAQVGKSFRNEITPGNFIFRTREFEQMELQFFCKPGTDTEWYEYWKKYCMDFLTNLGIGDKNLRFREHGKDELSFYSKGTFDIEYNYPMGWGELWGIANRTDYDLSKHMEHSKENLMYLDPETNERYIPYVIEPSLGLTRLLLVIMCDAYNEETLEDGTVREVLKLHPYLAPYKVAVLPLVKKYHKEKATEIYQNLVKHFPVDYDESGSIGKRYRRQDVIGTPFCITIDEETISNGTVTVRHRDSMQQEVIKLDELTKFVGERISF